MTQQETKQVQTLKEQERFIKYGVGLKKCHYCDEKLYQVTLEYFDGNEIVIRDSHDRATKENGHEYSLVSLNHENENHHEQFQKDIKAYKAKVSNKVRGNK